MNNENHTNLNETNEISEIPDLPEEQKTALKPNLKIYLLIALIVPITIVFGMWLGSTMQGNNDQSIHQAVSTEENADIADTVKTYINKAFGYSFQYPATYSIDHDISTDDPESAVVVVFEDKPIASLAPGEKSTSFVIGYVESPNLHTCSNHEDSYAQQMEREKNYEKSKRVIFSEVTEDFLDLKVKGMIIREIVERNIGVGESISEPRFTTIFPLCQNNKYFEIRFNYTNYLDEESGEIVNDPLVKTVLNSFQLFDATESPALREQELLDENQKELVTIFQSEILRSNSATSKVLSDKRIVQIFKTEEIYTIKTLPKDFVQGLTFMDEDAVNVYVVNKEKYFPLMENEHDVYYIKNVYFNQDNGVRRIIVHIGGGPHVGDIYIFDADQLSQIKITDPSQFAEKVENITHIPFMSTRENGSVHAESFKLMDGRIYVSTTDVAGEWGVYYSIDLSSGKYGEVKVEKNPPIGGRNYPEEVFDTLYQE